MKGVKQLDILIQPRWLKLHPNRLHNLLMRDLGLSSADAARTVTRVLDIRKAGRSRQAKRTTVQILWDEVLTPCRNERMVVRTMKSQAKAAARKQGKETDLEQTLRWRALCAYEDVLVLWVERLKNIRKLGEHSPKQFAQTLRSADKYVGGDGTHWTDYVPPRVKVPIIEMFASLPPAKRGRGKIPFQRTAPPDLREEQRMRLVKALAEELGRAESERSVTPSAYERERLDALIDRIHRAQYLTENYPKKKAYPASWQRLLE